MPAGVLIWSIAVKRLRPKKNDNPQSNDPVCGPPEVLNAKLPVFDSISKLSIVKFTVTGAVMFVPWFPADKLAGDVGQYQSV